jgi:hypothetical protein
MTKQSLSSRKTEGLTSIELPLAPTNLGAPLVNLTTVVLPETKVKPKPANCEHKSRNCDYASCIGFFVLLSFVRVQVANGLPDFFFINLFHIS